MCLSKGEDILIAGLVSNHSGESHLKVDSKAHATENQLQGWTSRATG